MNNNKNFFLNLIKKIKNIFSKSKNKNKELNKSKKQDDDIYPLF